MTTSSTDAADAPRTPQVQVRDLEPRDHAWAEELIARESGGTRMVARLGELIDPLTLDGLVAESGGRPIGVATVQESPERGMEIVTLHADVRGRGAGTALLATAWQVAAASRHHRLWLVTTNDNLDAIHFYLGRGMHLAAIHADQVTRDRELKPQIAEVNLENGLALRDLLEFEIRTDAPDGITRMPFPAIEDLNPLPVASFIREVTPLFEGAPRLLEGLADQRPFETDDALIRAAFEVAHGLTEDAQLELLEAHPRIGAPPETVSSASYAEQGYAEEAAEDPDTMRAYEELAALNEIYEEQFGFRYVVFVAGRPKTEIVPLLEHALRNDRQAELRRAVDDTIYIAGDRLRTLRGLGTEV